MSRRKGPPFAWIIGGLATLAFLVAAAGVVWQTLFQPKAPADPGVCWRMAGTPPRFTRLSTGAPNLESCAAALEAIYLRDGQPVAGAYQGRFLFVDAEAIKSADELNGGRWRLFFDPQRARLDQDIRSRQTRAAARAAVQGAPIVTAPPPPP